MENISLMALVIFLGLMCMMLVIMLIPLQEGDVITIEPGIYIPEEKLVFALKMIIGLPKMVLICLSEHLPKEIADIEAAVQQALSGMNDDEDEDDEDYG